MGRVTEENSKKRKRKQMFWGGKGGRGTHPGRKQRRGKINALRNQLEGYNIISKPRKSQWKKCLGTAQLQEVLCASK